MDELLRIPACANERLASLRLVYDKINVHIRGLSSLGIESERYGSLLIPVIMTKVPMKFDYVLLERQGAMYGNLMN